MTTAPKKPRDPRLELADQVWDSAGTSKVKSVVHALFRYLNRGWQTTTSVPKLADIAGVNEKTAREILAALVKAGGIERSEMYWLNRQQTSPAWTVVPDALVTAVVSVSAETIGARAAPIRKVVGVPTVVPHAGTMDGTPTSAHGGTNGGTVGVPTVGPVPVPFMGHDPESMIRGVDPGMKTDTQPPADAGPPRAEPGSGDGHGSDPEADRGQRPPVAHRDGERRGPTGTDPSPGLGAVDGGGGDRGVGGGAGEAGTRAAYPGGDPRSGGEVGGDGGAGVASGSVRAGERHTRSADGSGTPAPSGGCLPLPVLSVDLPSLLRGDQTLLAPLAAAGILTPGALTALTSRELQHRPGIGPRRLAAIVACLGAAGMALRVAEAPPGRGDGVHRPGLRELTDRWGAAYASAMGAAYVWTPTGRSSDQAAARVLYDTVGWSEEPSAAAVEDAGGAVRRYLADCRRIGRTATLPDLVAGLARWRQAPPKAAPDAPANRPGAPYRSLAERMAAMRDARPADDDLNVIQTPVGAAK